MNFIGNYARHKLNIFIWLKISSYILQNLPYLDMVVHETLRLHPPGVLSRVCVKDFTGEGLDIKKGTQIHIPVIGIHMDPRHYPNPEVFNPENFSKDNRAKRSP